MQLLMQWDDFGFKEVEDSRVGALYFGTIMCEFELFQDGFFCWLAHPCAFHGVRVKCFPSSARIILTDFMQSRKSLGIEAFERIDVRKAVRLVAIM